MLVNPGWLVLLVTIVVTLVIVVIYMSTRSTGDEIQLGGAPPPPPSQLSETNLTSTSVTLSWQSHISATGYDVQYQISGNNTWVDFNTVSVNTAIVTGLVPSTKYNFRLMAVNKIQHGFNNT
jgi:hypothetical protein